MKKEEFERDTKEIRKYLDDKLKGGEFMYTLLITGGDKEKKLEYSELISNSTTPQVYIGNFMKKMGLVLGRQN